MTDDIKKTHGGTILPDVTGRDLQELGLIQGWQGFFKERGPPATGTTTTF